VRLYPASRPASLLLFASLAAAPLAGCIPAMAAQAAQNAPAPTRTVGTLSAVSPASLTVKAQDGTESTLSVDAQTRVLRAAPGAKTLSDASPIQLSDLAAGDRVLVVGRPAGTGMRASTVVAMKSADIAQTHARESQAWQQRGVGGVVRSVTPGNGGGNSGTVVLASGQPGHTLTLQLATNAVVHRYAPASVNYADSLPSTLAQIHPGDQLRALPVEGASGDTLAVEQVVAGSFENIAATVISSQPGSITVADLATKKAVTLQLTPQTQLRRLPPEIAQRMARRAQASAGGGEGAATRPAAAGGANDSPQSAPPAHPRGDLGSMLARAPELAPTDLKKGDALMIVATQGASPASAITVLAGVEPVLQASGGSASANQDVFSASWNLGGGGAGAEAPQ
jgi:hypothetical protein